MVPTCAATLAVLSLSYVLHYGYLWLTVHKVYKFGRIQLISLLFTARNEVGARLYFHRCVWFCSQGGLPQCMLGYPPDQASPRPGTPWPGTPRSRHPPNKAPPRPGTWPEQTPPRPGTPPSTEHAGRYGQRAGGTHPTGMQSCLFTCVYSYVGQKRHSVHAGHQENGGCCTRDDSEESIAYRQQSM